MRIPDYLLDFLAGPAMLLVGTGSPAHVPAVGRAVGLRLAPGGEAVDLVISQWQWPDTIDNIARTGALALTMSRPSDYVTYQCKGQAVLRDAAAADLELAAGHARRMTDCLVGLGVAPVAAGTWLCVREPVVARLAIDVIFVQTPGASAGASIGTLN